MKDAHGLRGELYVQLFAKSADWLESADKLFLEKLGDQDLSPFEILKARPFKEGLIVSLKGIPDRTAAEPWRKAKVFIHEDALVSPPGERVFLHQILNFEVLDGENSVGRVVGFATNGPQDLLRVATPNGTEALVPFVDAFILSIDFDKRQLKMDLPPGLLTVEEE